MYEYCFEIVKIYNTSLRSDVTVKYSREVSS